MKDKDVLRILQFTDTHLSADAAKIYYGVNTDESLRQVIHHANTHYPQTDLAVVTGDLIHDDTEAAYERLKNHFKSFKAPVLYLPGNHDVTALMKKTLIDDVRVNRSMIKKGWQIILLDSTVPGEVGGYLSHDELNVLDQCLRKHPEHHALICLHHPPFLTGCHWLDNGLILNNPEDLFAVLDRHDQVRSVIWGHMHQEFSAARNGVEYLATPSTMIQFKPNSHDFAIDNKPPGFRWLDLYGDGRIETGAVYL